VKEIETQGDEKQAMGPTKEEEPKIVVSADQEEEHLMDVRRWKWHVIG